MVKSMIVDAAGRPFDAAQLTEEAATGGIANVRQVWREAVARGLTPARLASLLERAAQGDADDYLTLAEEMEERDLHYQSVLATRKRAVTRLPVIVESASDSAQDVALADDVRGLVRRPGFRTMLKHLMDGLGKGYSVVEIRWLRGQKWQPRGYEHRDPRWFTWDRETGRELRMRDAADPVNGVPLRPYTFIVHRPVAKSGLPIRNGLARMVSLVWLMKSFALKDWNAFAELFGLPLRIGRFGPNATPDDVAVLKRAVAALGTDAAAILPESMKIEFQQVAAGGGGESLFERLCDYLDRQVSKGVLGQTMTADAQSAGLGSAQANVQNEVRNDIREDDALELSETLTRDLVMPYIDLNYGPQAQYPELKLQILEPEDLDSLSQNLERLVPLGLEVEQSVIRDKFGLPEPAKGAKLLGAPAAPSPPALNRGRLALNAAAELFPDPAEQLARNLDRQAQDVYARLLEPVLALLDGAASLEEVRERLETLYPDMDESALVSLMREAFAAATLAGRDDVLQGR